jgi:hypothetical protein
MMFKKIHNFIKERKIHLEKEETSRWQEDPVLGDFEWHSILVPDNARLRNALGFTIYGHGIVSGYCRIDGMLDNSWLLEG